MLQKLVKLGCKSSVKSKSSSVSALLRPVALPSSAVLRPRELLLLVSVLLLCRKERPCNRDVFRQPVKPMLFACKRLPLLEDKLPCLAIITQPTRLVRERRKPEDTTPTIIESALSMQDVMLTTCATSCSPKSVLLRPRDADKLLLEETLQSLQGRELLPSEPKSRKRSSAERPRLSVSDSWPSRSARCKRRSASECSQPRKLLRSAKRCLPRRRLSKNASESCREMRP